MTPDIVIGQQHEVAAISIDRVLDRCLGEVGAVAIPDEFHPVAIRARFRRRGRVGVEVDHPIALRDLADRIGHARADSPDEKAAFFAGDHPFRHTTSRRSGCLGVEMCGLDLTSENASCRIGFGKPAISMPRRSEAPELAYWPLASEVSPMRIGLSVVCA